MILDLIVDQVVKQRLIDQRFEIHQEAENRAIETKHLIEIRQQSLLEDADKFLLYWRNMYMLKTNGIRFISKPDFIFPYLVKIDNNKPT